MKLCEFAAMTLVPAFFAWLADRCPEWMARDLPDVGPQLLKQTTSMRSTSRTHAAQ
jgi:hypothetical protein